MRTNHWVIGIGAAMLLVVGSVLARPVPAASPTHTYAIAAGDLGVVLNELAAQGHAQILYAPNLVKGKSSAGLSGDYSVTDALDRVLRGTALRGEAVNGDTYVVRAAADPAPPATPKQQHKQPPPKPKTLQAVQVTGSLIPEAEIETATPTIRITAQQMTDRGFNTVYNALRTLPFATGAVPGPQGASTYTTGAQKLSLFGLPPGFTLVMVNGHPLPDYPLLYNGTSNFNDLAQIPIGMVDHVDIVPGNQSAVYGSSAIAGVVNIVLKKHVQGIHLTLRDGGYTQGGGVSQRADLVGGYTGLQDRLDVTYGFQFSNQNPIWAFDRSLTTNTASNPTTPTPVANQTFMHAYFDSDGNEVFVAPPAGACNKVASLFDNSTYLAQTSSGYYCGSNVAGDRTMLNGDRQYTGYGSGTYRLNDNAELYGTAMYTIDQQRYAPLGGFIWLPDIAGLGLFVDGNTGQLSTAWRQLAPEEQDYATSATTQSVHSYQAVFGVRGNVGSSDWTYDGSFDRAEQIVNNRQLHPLTAAVDAFFQAQFLGPPLGTDPATGYPIFDPDWNNFYQAITPAQYRSFSAYVETRSSSMIEHATLLASNTDLFSLPAGNAGFAVQAQVGHQTWDNPTDPRVVNGDFWGLSGTTGSGTRNSSSIAAELNVPITRMLTADAAARYDDYRYAGRSDGKATWRIGFEFRPIDTLLFRANYATAFRAPDMGQIFLAPSSNFFGVTDYYLCDVRQPGVPLPDCAYDNVQTRGVDTGNPNLKDITAKSWGGGVVWSPTHAFRVHADYLHISIANQIEQTNIDQLLRNDASCLLGQLDPSSPTCTNTESQVTRDSNGNITFITSVPINIANQKLKTATVGARYELETPAFGTFTFDAEYNDVLMHKQQLYPGDPVDDLLRDPTQSTEFKTIVNGSIHWSLRRWNATLFAVRYGSTPNFNAQLAGYGTPGAGTLGPWTTYNASVAYQFLPQARISLSVNNLFDKAPPVDSTYAFWPYYNVQNYNIWGRAYYVQLDWSLGTGG